MSLGLVFWILMLIWVAFSAASFFPGSSNWPAGLPWANNFLLFLLFLLLGWASFGAPIRG